MNNNDKKLFFDNVKEFEGFRSRSYLCPAGRLTIGYGHTKGVKPNSHVTLEEADKLLISDFDYLLMILKSFDFNLQDHELFAIADFIFNLGLGTFVRSSLYRLLTCYSKSRSQDLKSRICSKIKEFVYYTDPHGKKRKSLGLVRRRKFEATLFEYGEVISYNT